MNVHDWSRVKAGIFHDFHHEWTSELKRALNAGRLPEDYYASVEQWTGRHFPDVLALRGSRPDFGGVSAPGGAATAVRRPRLGPVARIELDAFARKRPTVTVRHVTDDQVVAVIEIVSPGNKASRQELHRFFRKSAAFLRQGIHVTMLDVLPPKSARQGLHFAFWNYLSDEASQTTALTFASYEATGGEVEAYVLSGRAGEPPPEELPLFLEPGGCVPLPVAATYAAAFAVLPRPWQAELAGP